MNRLENWFCSTRLWRRISEKQILPWLLSDASLGGHVLEIGAGAGAGTRELQRRAARVTSLEYDHHLASKLAARHRAVADVAQGRAVQDAHAVQGAGVVQAVGVVQGAGHMQDARIAQGAHVVHGVDVVQGDAAMLPFASQTFSAVVAVLMLHHLPSSEAQDRAFAEIARVLRPGGHFYAFDIPDGWFQRLTHWRSTFVPLQPSTIAERLAQAGLSDARVHVEKNGFRVRALRLG